SKTFIAPSTALTVQAQDRLTGLPNGAVGTVSYTRYTSANALSDCTNGTGGGSMGGGGNVTSSAGGAPTIPPSSFVTLPAGSSDSFFTATFTGSGGTTPSGVFTTPCAPERV